MYFLLLNLLGWVICFYKFIVDVVLFVGFFMVCENGVFVGNVSFGSIVVGQFSDFLFGVDFELCFSCSVIVLNIEKDGSGCIFSCSYCVSYVLMSIKLVVIIVQVCEQVYGQSVVVDGKVQIGNLVMVIWYVIVFVGGKVNVIFMLKVCGG